MEEAPVLDRYGTTQHGWFVVTNLRAARGDVLRCGDDAWIVLGVETFRIDNPPLPWGLLVGFQRPPDVGMVLTLEPRGALAAARRRILELESDRSRLDNLLVHAYRDG